MVLSIRYTAREGGDLLRVAAKGSIAALLNPTQTSTSVPLPEPLRFPVVLSCRSDFPTEWAHAKANPSSNLVIPITRSLLPYWMDAAIPNLTVREISVAALPVTSTPAFSIAWRRATGNTSLWVLNTNDEGTGNLGTVAAGVDDQMVLLWVGV